jgi:hypothetical protein
MLKLTQLALLVLTVLSLHMGAIQAEMQQVTLRWTAMLCQPSCVRGLEHHLSRVRGVTHVNINGPAGQADLIWDPAVPFTYRSIENAVAMIGIGLNDLRITVRGTITYDGRNVFLNSDGDKTRFYLLGPPEIVLHQKVDLNSPYNRPLLPHIKAQLLEASRNQQTVTITGPLFHPENSPPLYLVVAFFNINSDKE